MEASDINHLNKFFPLNFEKSKDKNKTGRIAQRKRSRFSPSSPGFESHVYSSPFSSGYLRDFANAVSSEGLKYCNNHLSCPKHWRSVSSFVLNPIQTNTEARETNWTLQPKSTQTTTSSRIVVHNQLEVVIINKRQLKHKSPIGCYCC